MTYEAFLEMLLTPFHIFFYTITRWSSALFDNYYFITILGAGLFCSFVLFCFNHFVLGWLKVPSSKYEEYNDLYKNYDLYQDVKMDWFKNNRDKIYAYRYDNYGVNQNVRDLYNDTNKKSKKIKKSSNDNIEPEWLNKDYISIDPTSPDEQAELQELLNNF